MSEVPPPTAQSKQVLHEQLLRRLALSGLLEDGEVLWLPSAAPIGKPHLGICTLSGRMTFKAHVVQIRVLLPAEFPHCLPGIMVSDISPPVELPHLIERGWICFPEDANLLDVDEPYSVAWEALRYTRELLGRLLTENQREAEFVQEAFAYWRSYANVQSADCVVSAGEYPGPIVALFEGEKLKAFADDRREYIASRPGCDVGRLVSTNAIYLPIGHLKILMDRFPCAADCRLSRHL